MDVIVIAALLLLLAAIVCLVQWGYVPMLYWFSLRLYRHARRAEVGQEQARAKMQQAWVRQLEKGWEVPAPAGETEE